MNTPVIFLVFNRPDHTRRVFDRIRQAKPAQLLVVCDGPRPDVPADIERIAAVREIIDGGIDWPCEVLRNYAGTNLGCRDRVASGLTWAFSKVEEAIVIEDDCLPEPSFFGFCEELLARYRDDARIMHIAGTNLAAPYLRLRASYWFSHQPAIWGWATWRRAWLHYDLEMRAWEERSREFRASFASRWEAQYWLPIIDRARREAEKGTTWDFAWVFACRARRGLCIMPTCNLVENIGFGDSASHTTDSNPRHQVPSRPVGVLRHPARIAWNRFADELVTRAYAGELIDRETNLRSRLRILRDSLSVR